MRYSNVIVDKVSRKTKYEANKRMQQGTQLSLATGEHWDMIDKYNSKLAKLVNSGNFEFIDHAAKVASQETDFRISEEKQQYFILRNAPVKVFLCDHLGDCGSDLSNAVYGRISCIEALVKCQQCPNRGRGYRACYGCNYRYIPHDSVEDIPHVLAYEISSGRTFDFKNIKQLYQELNESAIRRMHDNNKLERYEMVYSMYTAPTPWLGVRNLSCLVIYWFDGSREKFIEYAKAVVDAIKEQGNWDVDFDTHAKVVSDCPNVSTYIETRAANRAGVSTLGTKGRRVTYVSNKEHAKMFTDKRYEEDVVNEFLSLTYYVTIGFRPMKKCLSVSYNHTSFMVPVYRSEEVVDEFLACYGEDLTEGNLMCANTVPEVTDVEDYALGYPVEHDDIATPDDIPDEKLRAKDISYKVENPIDYDSYDDEDEFQYKDWSDNLSATPVYVDVNNCYKTVGTKSGESIYVLPGINLEYVNTRGKIGTRNK